jgi:hypothetical protein
MTLRYYTTMEVKSQCSLPMRKRAYESGKVELKLTVFRNYILLVSAFLFVDHLLLMKIVAKKREMIRTAAKTAL